MELTYQEAGKPLPKAYDGDEGLISFTLEHMEESIMEKVLEQRLRVTGSDTWGTWGEFTKDAKHVALHRQHSRAAAQARRRRGRTLRPRACCRWRESSHPPEGCRAPSSPRSLSSIRGPRRRRARTRAREGAPARATRDATQRHAHRALFAFRSLARTQPPSQARDPRVACARRRGVLTTSPLELRDRLASRRPRRAVAASSLARGSAVLASTARRRTPLAPTAHDVPSEGWPR